MFSLVSFPGATNETLLQKFNSVQKHHEFYQVPQRREAAFIVRHYAGKVKYQVRYSVDVETRLWNEIQYHPYISQFTIIFT